MAHFDGNVRFGSVADVAVRPPPFFRLFFPVRHQPNSPNTARPDANNGRAAGKGMADICSDIPPDTK